MSFEVVIQTVEAAAIVLGGIFALVKTSMWVGRFMEATERINDTLVSGFMRNDIEHEKIYGEMEKQFERHREMLENHEIRIHRVEERLPH